MRASVKLAATLGLTANVMRGAAESPCTWHAEDTLETYKVPQRPECQTSVSTTTTSSELRLQVVSCVLTVGCCLYS